MPWRPSNLGTERAHAQGLAARLAALLLCACAPPMLDAATATLPATGARAPGEVEVEAAYLVNFLRYTQWPPAKSPAAGVPYVVTVVGSQGAADSVRAVC